MIKFTPSKLKDCMTLAPKMRHVDVKEIRASSGLPPYDALAFSINLEGINETIWVNDKIVAMCGIADKGTIGIPWMLGTDTLKKNAKSLLPISKKWVEKHGAKFDLMFNYVSAENLSSIRWLKYLGFTLIRYIPEHGVGRKPFYEFVRIKEDV